MSVVRSRLDELDFEPPGPGSWERERTHMPFRVTPHFSQEMPEAFWAGFRETCDRYGLLIEGLRMEVVNGYVFGAVRPADLSEFPARVERAANAWETRQWLADLERWDNEARPATLARHAELVAVQPDSLGDEALVSYLAECAAHHAAMVAQHHSFNGACLMPLGDFLSHASRWTGTPPPELLGLFAGCSPASAGDCPELRALAGAVSHDPGARTLVADGDLEPGMVLDQLAAADGPVGPATRAWLDLAGHRLVDGFDIWCPTALEQPGHLLDTLRRAIDPPQPADPASAVAAVRAQVPAEHRDEFDRLYDDARRTYRLRDERGLYCDLLAAGVMRRAMLTAGRRLAERGLIDAPEQAVEASRAEIAGLLLSGAGPSGAELAARAGARLDDSGVPDHLGDPPSPPPPLDMLPPPAKRAMGALLTCMGMLSGTVEPAGEGVLRGLAGSPGFHAGRARVIRTPDDLSRVREGDVVVAACTSAAFNVALAHAGAVVTDHGGPLSHAAITAREFGIPAVVGAVHATARIADGASVAVDGNSGEVTLL